MYVIDPEVKSDPVRRWALPDRVFFAAGGCHILAHAAVRAWAGFTPIWLRPLPGFRGNHIVARRGDCAFDYHGFTRWRDLIAHMFRKARRWWPGWDCTQAAVPPHALIAPESWPGFGGFRLRPPQDFLHNPIPRAERFLGRFAAPNP